MIITNANVLDLTDAQKAERLAVVKELLAKKREQLTQTPFDKVDSDGCAITTAFADLEAEIDELEREEDCIENN